MLSEKKAFKNKDNIAQWVWCIQLSAVALVSIVFTPRKFYRNCQTPVYRLWCLTTGFDFRIFKKTLCVLCICRYTFTILKHVILLKAMKRFRFYWGQGSLSFTCPWCNFTFFSYNLVLKLHRYELVFGIIWCIYV